MKRKSIIIIVVMVVLTVFIALFYLLPLNLTKNFNLKKEISIKSRLEKNPNTDINQEFVLKLGEPPESLNLPEGLTLPVGVYSWSTKYGRIYARQCSGPPYDGPTIVCNDGGTTFYDSYGEVLTNCGGGWGEEAPFICLQFFKKLKAVDADFRFVEN